MAAEQPVRPETSLVGYGNWRPRCYRCERFVPKANYDCFYDYYAGVWEEGYTECSPGKGCRKPATPKNAVRTDLR